MRYTKTNGSRLLTLCNNNYLGKPCCNSSVPIGKHSKAPVLWLSSTALPQHYRQRMATDGESSSTAAQEHRDTTSPGGSARKRTLTFVSEGVTDLETQRAREQIEQAKFEAECKRRERKSLREQLKANAISKQKEFNGLVKERDDVNRLSNDDLAHIKRLAEQDRQREKDLKQYLETHSEDFDSRQRQQLAKTRHGNSPVNRSPPRNANALGALVKVTKPTKKKINFKLNPALPSSKKKQ